MDHPKQNVSTLIVLVNWRSPWDTLECLESLLQQDRDDWSVVVVDNASGDDSVYIFQAWAEGRLCGLKPLAPHGPTLGGQLYAESRPNVRFVHPVDLGGNRNWPVSGHIAPKDVIFAVNDLNGGFAAGNNVGLRFAEYLPNLKWIWLLNNDTVVHPAALRRQIEKSDDNQSDHIIGSTVMEYYSASAVQYNAGASYNNFTAKVQPIKHLLPGNIVALNEGVVERDLSYIVGASMFLPARTFKKIGYMREQYFLYYEELDWPKKNKNININLLYASQSFVYHKEGGATGGKTDSAKKGWTAEYYSARSRLLYTLLNCKIALFSIVPLQFLVLLKRMVRDKNLESSKIIIRAMRDAVSTYISMKTGTRDDFKF